MVKSGEELLIEFTQTYPDGARVVKRGLDASPLVVRKFDLGTDEVMAFTNWHGRRKAMTAYHFHPDFAASDRHGYMEAHDEGRQMIAAVAHRLREERRHRWVDWNARLAKRARAAGRVLDLALAAVAGSLSPGPSPGVRRPGSFPSPKPGGA